MSTVTTSLLTAYLRLVDDPPVDVVDPSTGKGPEWGKASPVGLLIILLLSIATFFLLRSMTRRLKRVQNGVDAPPVDDLDITTVDEAALTEPPTDDAPAAGRTQRSGSGSTTD